MAKEATTVYIDDSAIWVLVARGRQVQKWYSMPLEPVLVKEGVILDEDAVAAKLRELWQTEGIGTKQVIVGVSGINCLHRTITLPQLPKNLLPEAVRREAGRVLGVPLEQLYLSWQSLPSLRGETLTYLAASPRNSVDSLISTLRKAGLSPYLMDIKPLAIARTSTEPRAIIIDLQPSSLDIVIISEGMPQVVRSLPLSREASLERKIAITTEELGRVITFYNSSHVDKPVEATVPLLVSGELARRDAQELLGSRVDYPIQVLPSPMEANEEFPASQYATCIGLALKPVLSAEKGAVSSSSVTSNVIPELHPHKPPSLSEVLFRPVIIGGVALIVLGAFFSFTIYMQNDALRVNLAAINQMAVSRHVTFQDITALRGEVTSLETERDAFSATLGDFEAGRDEVNGDLAEINSSLPGTVDLSSVADKGAEIRVTGVGDNKDAVFSYAKNLRSSRRFALVVITDMHKEESQMAFTLMLTK